MNIKIEIAKSYFTLATILILLSGFLFASSSISYSAMMDNFDKAASVTYSGSYQYNYSDSENSKVDLYNNLTDVSFKLWKFFLVIGLFSALASLISWNIGKRKLISIK